MKSTKPKLIPLCAVTEFLIIVSIGCANINPEPINYFVFYNLIYGVILSLLLPLFILRREEKPLESVGLKALGKRQIVVLLVFVVFSVGGQLIPIAAKGGVIPWNLLPAGVVPLIMTTFFEEFLFRGFFQSRIEKSFGVLPAILASGLMFSLYHLGYPGFRALGDLALLFAVGVGFALAFKLSENNLIVAYFVNLPNAFVTYMLKFDQFPAMGTSSTIAAAVTLCIIAAVFYVFTRANRTHIPT